MIFHSTVGEANTYVIFVHGTHTIFNHNHGQLSVSMNAVPIKAKKKSTINYDNIKTKTPKNSTSKCFGQKYTQKVNLVNKY